MTPASLGFPSVSSCDSQPCDFSPGTQQGPQSRDAPWWLALTPRSLCWFSNPGPGSKRAGAARARPASVLLLLSCEAELVQIFLGGKVFIKTASVIGINQPGCLGLQKEPRIYQALLCPRSQQTHKFGLQGEAHVSLDNKGSGQRVRGRSESRPSGPDLQPTR